jgi:hypothetical protein
MANLQKAIGHIASLREPVVYDGSDALYRVIAIRAPAD